MPDSTTNSTTPPITDTSHSVFGHSAVGQSTFGTIARTLHWLVAGGIVVQYILAELAEEAEARSQQLVQLAVLANHKSVGITLLVLVLMRLLWRQLSKQPPPAPGPAWQMRSARISHALLYVLLGVLPVSGWLMSSATAYSVSWFNLFQLPDLIDPSDSAKALWSQVHDIAGKALLVLTCAHILAALKHYMIDKDSVMERMATPPGLIAFALVSIGGVWLFGLSNSAPANAAQTAPAVVAVSTPAPNTATHEREAQPATDNPAHAPLPAWSINYEDSSIRFTATQAGASFEGRWLQWEADVHFAPEQLAQSRAEVRIQAANVATGDKERDDTLASGDWFDSTSFATVTFTTQQIVATDTGYQATAQLKIRGVAYPVRFDFQLSTTENGATLLTGTSQLDRLALGLGVVEWADTQWVGQEVAVTVRLVQSRAATPSR